MDQAERKQRIQAFIADVDWDSYDYTKAPGANMKFPDFSEAEMATKDFWSSKHYNKTGGMNCCHVADLNQIADGQERKFLAVYGVPVEWPSKEEDEDGLKDLLDELDSARESGGDEWKEAMDSHGLLNDEHYVWLRGRKLGFPESLQNYEAARAAITAIDEAIAAGDDVFDEHGFRDKAHYEWFKKRVEKAKAQAWVQHNAVLAETQKGLDERFEKNKAALSNELAPFKGVSMEDWAGANAALVGSIPLENILRILKIERPTWDAVNAEWNARMSRDTTATIGTVYGQAFTAGPGKFAGGGGGAAKAAEPISFEQWIKIQAHIGAAAAQGKDVNGVLREYKLTAGEWGTIGGHWAMKMGSNPQEYLEKFQTLTAKYTAAFASGKAGSDIDF